MGGLRAFAEPFFVRGKLRDIDFQLQIITVNENKIQNTMEQEMLIQIVLLVLFFVLIGLIARVFQLRDRRKQDRQNLTEFIRCMIASFHEVSTHHNPEESKSEFAEKVTRHIRSHTGTEFRILMMQTKTFPRKCHHPSVESSTKQLVNDVFPLLADLHSIYQKNPDNLDALKDEFYQKLEGFLLKLDI